MISIVMTYITKEVSFFAQQSNILFDDWVVILFADYRLKELGRTSNLEKGILPVTKNKTLLILLIWPFLFSKFSKSQRAPL